MEIKKLLSKVYEQLHLILIIIKIITGYVKKKNRKILIKNFNCKINYESI